MRDEAVGVRRARRRTILMAPADQQAVLDAAIRPRERLLQHGAHTLTDAELVSVLLSSGRADMNAVAVAERLLTAVGGVPGLARCHPEALSRLPGLGEVTAARLVAALALPLRRDTMNTVKVTNPADLLPVLRPVLARARHERLVVAVCDRKLRVRAVRAIADGATDGCPLPVRDLLTTVLRHEGYAFAIAHNHPSGDPTPSAADRNTTMRCATAAQAVDLKFLGHLVLGDDGTWEQA
jgi:DNA repair protein RadC